MSWQRIRHIIRKEFIQIRRDPRVLRIILVAPVFQLIVFGYAVTTDVKHVPTAVVDSDRTRQSRDLLSRFVNSGYFDVLCRLDSPREIEPLLASGVAQVAIWIPKGFGKDLAQRRSASLQIALDGSDSTTAGVVMGYAAGIVRRFSEDVLSDRIQRLGLRLTHIPDVEDRVRVWYNPDLKSVNYMVPGVLCMILLIVTMLLTSLAIVREREIGTLEQLIVTPIRTVELIIGKTVPFVVIGYVDVMLILLVARLHFRVPIAGSVPLLLVLTGVFLMTTLGVGLFVSTVSRTQQQAMMTAFFIIMPSILLSGFMFPIDNMPRPVQYLTYLIPLRYYLEIIRGIFLKGAGLDVMWPNAAALAAFGIVILTLSALRFAKRIA